RRRRVFVGRDRLQGRPQAAGHRRLVAGRRGRLRGAPRLGIRSQVRLRARVPGVPDPDDSAAVPSVAAKNNLTTKTRKTRRTRKGKTTETQSNKGAPWEIRRAGLRSRPRCAAGVDRDTDRYVIWPARVPVDSGCATPLRGAR